MEDCRRRSETGRQADIRQAPSTILQGTLDTHAEGHRRGVADTAGHDGYAGRSGRFSIWGNTQGHRLSLDVGHALPQPPENLI